MTEKRIKQSLRILTTTSLVIIPRQTQTKSTPPMSTSLPQRSRPQALAEITEDGRRCSSSSFGLFRNLVTVLRALKYWEHQEMQKVIAEGQKGGLYFRAFLGTDVSDAHLHLPLARSRRWYNLGTENVFTHYDGRHLRSILKFWSLIPSYPFKFGKSQAASRASQPIFSSKKLQPSVSSR